MWHKGKLAAWSIAGGSYWSHRENTRLHSRPDKVVERHIDGIAEAIRKQEHRAMVAAAEYHHLHVTQGPHIFAVEFLCTFMYEFTRTRNSTCSLLIHAEAPSDFRRT